ncbi:MAG: hypothetical protein N2442_00100 [Spirochaetes bacterium]|nr:hypothetical protein [Spirochaetota bacterium]
MGLLSCSTPQVLWVVDSFMPPILGEEFPQRLAEIERVSGYRIRTIPYAFRENDRSGLEKLLSEGGYSFVVVSPYVAIELQALEVRFPDKTFLCLDAPEEFPFPANVRKITFDPVPALQEALKRWAQYKSSRSGKDKKLLILTKESLSLFQGLGFEELLAEARIVLVPKGEADEPLRKTLRKELAEPADLLILWAGRAGSVALEILSGLENRKIEGIIGLEVHRFPRIQEYPFVVSLHKDYAWALLQVLTTGSSIPSRLPYRIFSP